MKYLKTYEGLNDDLISNEAEYYFKHLEADGFILSIIPSFDIKTKPVLKTTNGISLKIYRPIDPL